MNNIYIYIYLVVRRCGEAVRLLRGDHGVAFDELSKHAALSLDAQSQGGDVEEEQICCLSSALSREDASLFIYAFFLYILFIV